MIGGGYGMKPKLLCALLLLALAPPLCAAAAEPVTVRVGLTRHFENRASIEIRNTGIAVGYGTQFGFAHGRDLFSQTGFTATISGGSVVLQAGGATVHTFSGGAAQIRALHGDTVLLDDRSYRGSIELARAAGGGLTAVNVLDLEEYLYGVLPAEMSPSWHIQALQAQAVAARTFAFNRIAGAGHDGFDICDSTHCQVYDGTAREHENTTRAVRQTRGLMLFHGGSTILANYFSSSGGSTDNSEDVWGSFRPYLRSVNEIHEHEPMVWERTFTWAELTYAAGRSGANIGNVTGISVSEIGVSGRATELTLHGAGGAWSVRSESIRAFFAPVGGSLPSRNFVIGGGLPATPFVAVTAGAGFSTAQLNTMYAHDVRGGMGSVHMGYIFDGVTMRRVDYAPVIVSGGAGITISGMGWGHGVGMSQRGAEGMARLGYSFIQILQHYYTGVEIRQR